MITAIIFDCFGVLYQGSLDRLIDMCPVDKRGELRDASRAADYGYLSRPDFVGRVSELTGKPVSDVEIIMTLSHVKNQPLLDHIKSIRGQYTTAMLSNIGQDAIGRLFDQSELNELFDVVVLSSDEGMVKPERRIYELTAERMSVSPESILMIDDSPMNVEGAIVAGMQGHIYRSFDEYVNMLKNLP